MLRPGLFGNEVARVLGGGLVPGQAQVSCLCNYFVDSLD